MVEPAPVWPRLVCPECRQPPRGAPLTDELVCSNRDCAAKYAALDGVIPAVVATRVRNQVDTLDIGPLPEPGALRNWLSELEPGTAAFNSTSRAAIFLRALADRARESFYGDFCEALLSPESAFNSAVDLGCGMGNLAVEIADRTGARVVGLDLDANLLRWGMLAASGEGFDFPIRTNANAFTTGSMQVERPVRGREIRFICGNVLDPPFEPGSFEMATLVNVLDNVPYPAVALRQAIALVKLGGYILFGSPDSWNVGTTPRERWLATSESGWDRVFAKLGLETLRRVDDLEWRLQDSPRLHHLYRVHGRLLRKGAEVETP